MKYSLTDDLAHRRCLYPRALPTLPDVLLVDVPPRFAGPDLPMGRYYPIILETPDELHEIESFLTEPRPGPVPPDLFDFRKSRLAGDRITIAACAPPARDWPHLLLCHWPASYAALAQDPMLFARGAYTTEIFSTEHALYRSCNRLLATLGERADILIAPISATCHVAGHA